MPQTNTDEQSQTEEDEVWRQSVEDMTMSEVMFQQELGDVDPPMRPSINIKEAAKMSGGRYGYGDRCFEEDDGLTQRLEVKNGNMQSIPTYEVLFNEDYRVALYNGTPHVMMPEFSYRPEFILGNDGYKSLPEEDKEKMRLDDIWIAFPCGKTSVKLVKKDGTMVKHMHGHKDNVCNGNYQFPAKPKFSDLDQQLDLLKRLFNDFEQLYRTLNIGSPLKSSNLVGGYSLDDIKLIYKEAEPVTPTWGDTEEVTEVEQQQRVEIESWVG